MSQLAKAYALSDVAATRSLYDEWASTYDKEMAEASQDYVGPVLAGNYVTRFLNPSTLSQARLLDAGCGTGLVGARLAKLGAQHIDGIDLSPGMLTIARRTGAYQTLEAVDLSKPIPHQDDSYNAVVCIGTFTQGHVGPEALNEFVRVVEKGGYIFATVLASIWESGGYEGCVDRLAREGKVKVVSTELEDYRRGPGVQARMIVLQIL